MIVHPIGMMRANVASGVDVFDDFSGYSAGQTLYAANGTRYSGLGGSTDPMIVNNGSYNVLRVSDGSSFIRILADLSPDREIGIVIDQVGAAGSNCYLNMSYIDAINYINFSITTGDTFCGPRQVIAGSNYLITGSAMGSVPANSDKFAGRMVGSTFSLWRNDVQINGDHTIDPAVLDDPMLSIDASSGRTVDIRSIYYRDVV